MLSLSQVLMLPEYVGYDSLLSSNGINPRGLSEQEKIELWRDLATTTSNLYIPSLQIEFEVVEPLIPEYEWNMPVHNMPMAA
jgi:hypothetical protein